MWKAAYLHWVLFGTVALSLQFVRGLQFSVQHLGFSAIKLNELLGHSISSHRRDPYTGGLGAQSRLFDDTEDIDISDHLGFTAYWFRQPLDHFEHTGHYFNQRYWVSDRHYRPGGPLIILDGGETSGVDRLPFLDTGIVNILSNATGGYGIVLEHRYYGKSHAVQNLTTDSLRWLNNAQSAADSANFIKHVKLPNLESGAQLPVIYYGGSYAGARAAHMRILYPDLVYGAIASSAVTHAQVEFPEYMEIIRNAAPRDCGKHMSNVISTVDFALSDSQLRNPIKRLFGLEALENDIEFATTIAAPAHYWQSKVWDPQVGSTVFDDFCKFLEKRPWRKHEIGSLTLDFALLNYAQWIRENVVAKCHKREKTIPECLSSSQSRDWEDTSLHAKWRLWFYQVCTEWGYFVASPRDANAARIVSRLITVEYLHDACQKAYPPGNQNAIPSWPNVTVVMENELGDFDIAADRLAIIDGEVDPWRPATPHSQYGQPREDTLNRPFKIIPNAVHHYDEYGLKELENEPPEIFAVHNEMISFVQHWLRGWNASQSSGLP